MTPYKVPLTGAFESTYYRGFSIGLAATYEKINDKNN